MAFKSNDQKHGAKNNGEKGVLEMWILTSSLARVVCV